MNDILSLVLEDIAMHCYNKGYREGPGVNNFIPHDAAAAFEMARTLATRFDQYVVVAPEGHIYGYFFEQLGIPVLSVFTNYPPTLCTSDDDLSVIKNKKVLLIEDDVVSGHTLRLVVRHLGRFKPASLSLYLGHNAGVQHLENIPKEIARDRILVAEQTLGHDQWMELDAAFTKFFKSALMK